MRRAFSILAGLAILGAVAAPGISVAQTDLKDQKISIDVSKADVREALQLLFKSTGGSYTVASDVQGTVTASLKGIAFETALMSILRQVDAVFRMEGGVYHIEKRKDDPLPELKQDTQPQVAQDPNRVRLFVFQINHADPQLIYMLLTGQVGFGHGPEISSGDFSSLPGGGGQGGFAGSGSGGFFQGQGGWGGLGYGGGNGLPNFFSGGPGNRTGGGPGLSGGPSGGSGNGGGGPRGG